MNRPTSHPSITRSKAPDVSKGLARRLRAMVRQIGTVTSVGGGLGSAELENLGHDLGEIERGVSALEENKPHPQNENVLKACQHLFDADGAFNLAFSSLRDRLDEEEIDPTGSILAALRVGQAFAAQAEAVLTGGRAS